MKKRKPAIIIVLILLALILSACSRKQKEEVTSLTDAWPQTEKSSEQPSISFPQDSPKPQNSENAPAETDAVEGYELATLPLPEGMVMATAQLGIRDRVYTAGIGATGAVFGYSCADHTRKTLELPKEYEFVYAMCQDGDNYSLLCGSYPIAYYDFEDNFTLNDPPKGDFEIITFDSNDTYISTLQLTERYTQNGFTFKQIYRINGGYILQCRAAIIVIGDDGNEKGKITLDETQQFDSLQMIEDEAFMNNKGLTIVELQGENLIAIGSGAFKGCTNLQQITIPVSVESIADDAFDGCDKLLIVCKSGSYAQQYANAHDITWKEY